MGEAPDPRAVARDRWRSEGWYPDLSMGQACQAAARSVPGSRLTFASRDDQVTLDRATLHLRARRVAAGLLEAGVTTGDAVVVQAPASVESTVALEALWLLGAVVIPVVSVAGEG